MLWNHFPFWMFGEEVIPFFGGLEQHVLMSDILFLSVKEHAGKLRENNGTKTTTGDLATLTATSGKDMYLGKAKINGKSTSGGINGSVQVVLKINGVIVETFDSKVTGPGAGEGEFSFDYEFNITGKKVAALQIIKLEVISVTTVTVNGSLECFEETTGESPFHVTEFS